MSATCGWCRTGGVQEGLEFHVHCFESELHQLRLWKRAGAASQGPTQLSSAKPTSTRSHEQRRLAIGRVGRAR